MNETDFQYQQESNEVVEVLDEQTPSFFKKQIHMLVYLITAVAAVFVIGILSVFLGLQINKSNLAQKRAETYKTSLLATEDGKRQLEEANNQLNSENKDLDKKASDANQKASDSEKLAADANQKAADSEQQAVDAKEQAAEADKKAAASKKKAEEANRQLEAKLAEVKKVSDELGSKKSELEKAQRGISKFGELETLFEKYDEDARAFTRAVNDVYVAVIHSDRAAYDKNCALLDTLNSRLNDEYNEITALFDVIRNAEY